MKLGAVIVLYNSADVIDGCLSSLLTSEHTVDRIVLCDNASSDDTVAHLRHVAQTRGIDWTELHEGQEPKGPLPQVVLLRAGVNKGFAGGVNLGLDLLEKDGCDLFWLLNPDGIAQPKTAGNLVACAQAHPDFGLMGGRIIYTDPVNMIQSDGGRIQPLTGTCKNINQGLKVDAARYPDAATLDFISGAHLLASRRFLTTVGPMNEDYFLYYEEVDWAMRRGMMSIVMCENAVVLHHGGTAIGTGAHNRGATGFANYFNYRNRIRYIRRFAPATLPIAVTYAALKVVKILLKDGKEPAVGALRGLLQLRPPKNVESRVAPEARSLAFGKFKAKGTS